MLHLLPALHSRCNGQLTEQCCAGSRHPTQDASDGDPELLCHDLGTRTLGRLGLEALIDERDHGCGALGRAPVHARLALSLLTTSERAELCADA